MSTVGIARTRRALQFVRIAQTFLGKAVESSEDETIKEDIKALSVSVKAFQDKHSIVETPKVPDVRTDRKRRDTRDESTKVV